MIFSPKTILIVNSYLMTGVSLYEPTTHCMTMSVISKIFCIKTKTIIVPNIKKISKIPFNLLYIQTKYGDSLRPRENLSNSI